MGTDFAPFLANLFLYSYECEWMDKMHRKNKTGFLKKFDFCCRYIDDLLCINYDEVMDEVDIF